MKQFYLILCISLAFFSCSDSSNNEPEPEYKPKYASFDLFIGEKGYVYVKEPRANCTLNSRNPEIAVAAFEVNSQWIEIEAKGSGSTLISVIDSSGKTIAEAFVSSGYFDSPCIEEITNHSKLRSEVFIEAQDAALKKQIEDELWQEIRKWQRTLYTFDSKTLKFTMINDKIGVKNEGTYEWSIDSLTLKYNDVVEKYGFKIDQQRRNYIIEINCTEAYKEKYPNAGISDVRYTRIWYDHNYLSI